VDLVAGEGEEVDIFERAAGTEVERQFARGLNGVSMEERSSRVCDTGEFCDGLNDAGLVIGEHDAHELRVGTNSGFESGGLDETLGRAGEEGNFDVSCRERFGGVKNGVMLDGCGDEMRAFGHGAEECEVIAFGATGGEDDLGSAATEEAGDRFARMVYGGAGILALLMDRTGIAEVLDPEGAHGLEYFGQKRGGGVRVHVDMAHTSILLPYAP